MKTILFTLVIALMAIANGTKTALPNAAALAPKVGPNGAESECGCKDGTTAPCTLNGKRGTKQCFNGRWGPCEVEEPPPPPPKAGTLHPKFYVLMVIYAPPGAQGGKSSSSVTYGSGSATGSTVSASNSFKQSSSVSITAGGGILGNGAQLGVSFGYGKNTTNNQSIDIKKSGTSEINVPGPAVDGVDHDRDQIWLWLNPSLRLSLTPTSAAWKLEDNPLADIQFVFVGHLKDPSKMPPGVAQRLQAHGITPQDYPQILKADPFANGATFIDAKRYQSLNTTFPYEPPFAAGDPVTTFKFNATFTSTATSSSSTQNEYNVGLTVSGEAGFMDLFKLSMKSQQTWTWTSTDTRAQSSSTTESATVTVGGPAFGYTGPTDMAVFYDVIYKTYMFAPIQTATFMSGVVKDNAGKLVIAKEVVIEANGVKYRTFTNARGEYRLLTNVSGPIRLQVGNTTRQLPQLPATRRFDIIGP